jgi:hypothetical protein
MAPISSVSQNFGMIGLITAYLSAKIIIGHFDRGLFVIDDALQWYLESIFQ